MSGNLSTGSDQSFNITPRGYDSCDASQAQIAAFQQNILWNGSIIDLY